VATIQKQILSLLATVPILFLFGSCQRTATVTPEEKAMLLTVRDFAAYGHEQFDTTREIIRKTINLFDRSQLIEYTYESDDTTGEKPLYLSCGIAIERTPASSRANKVAMAVGFKIGLTNSGIRSVPQPNFPQFGDNSTFTILEKDSSKVGNIFQSAIGRVSLYTIFTGLYVDDKDIWKEIIESKIAKIRKYQNETVKK
jgi:hypothetical protein